MGLTGDWDQRITRRTLLKTGGCLAAGITRAGIASGPAFGQAGDADNPFTLGVASGDPRPTGVVLWTRLAPDPPAVGGGMPAEPFEVRYEVSRDEDSTRSSARAARLRCPTRRTVSTRRFMGSAMGTEFLGTSISTETYPSWTRSSSRRHRPTRWRPL